jgi:hypothetical protein
MSINARLTLAAVIVLGAASAALANDIETNPSEAQSAREWAAYLGQTHGHKREMVFASNTYDSPDWAPVYVEPTAPHEPRVGAREKNADRYVRTPGWQPSSATDHPR